MKTFFTLFVIGVLSGLRVQAQDCDTLLHVQYSIQESRCMSTGSITLNVTGGSGNYNYRAIGPVTTPYTLSTQITGLSTGYYSVVIKDIVNDCEKTIDSLFVPGSYSDPRFQLSKVNVTCAGNNGSIKIVNPQFGRTPFIYRIIAPSVSHVGDTSSAGNFGNLTPGEYYIQLTDSCGGLQVRRITIDNYYWWINGSSVNKLGCDSAAVSIGVSDNGGKNNLSDTSFNDFSYAAILPSGDTLWSDTSSFHVFIGKYTQLTLLVKDPCGNINTVVWNMPSNQIPAVGSAFSSNLDCNSSTIRINTLTNIVSPGFCIYNSQDSLLRCDSSGIFNNMPYGSYCIKIHDACQDSTYTRCITTQKPKPSVAATVNQSQFTCTDFRAQITNQQNLVNAVYQLIDSAGNVIDQNPHGVFTNLPYGQYCIKITDDCADTTIMRCFIGKRPTPQINYINAGGYTCTTFNMNVNGNYLINPNYCIYDSSGALVSCDSSGHFNNLPFGQYCIRAVTACLDTSNLYCFTGSHPVPTGGNVNISGLTCNGFTASVSGQTNLTNAQYCLYNSNDSLLSCNYSGVFANINYGAYCIKIKDACVDTTIIRCFSSSRPIPSMNPVINVLNSGCTNVSIQASGSNMFSATYCLYDSAHAQVACNFNGRFENIPFGAYCVQVHDACTDTSFSICDTFAAVRGLNVMASRSCTLGKTILSIGFNNSNAPYLVKIYNPADSVVYNAVTSSNPLSVSLSGLSAGQQYVVEATNLCNLKDTVHITPQASRVTHQASVQAKCPTGMFLNGAGNVVAIAGTNMTGIVPSIIKKNNIAYNASYSNVVSDTFTFADLEPATYVIQYALTNCTTKVYDTVTVSPYSYPTQNQSTLYQCDNSGFSLDAVVQGGIGPYNYQIIGSTPSFPSINTASQTNPNFTINNGTTYSLIRLRTIDNCGNATLSDVSVLPLQNFTVTTNSLCFYNDITLSVESVPGASYYWYWKTTPVDSTLVGGGANYHLPFFVPEEAGYYVCKIIISNGCLTRLVQINMDGNCGGQILPNNVVLKGQRKGNQNELSWQVQNGDAVKHYILERKRGSFYEQIAKLDPKKDARADYSYLDAFASTAEYRVVMVGADGARKYTNLVILRAEGQSVTVYPNPASSNVNISVNGSRLTDYRIDITGSNGQLMFTKNLPRQQSFVFNYQRERSVPAGVYLVKITDLSTGNITSQKLILQ